MGGLEGSAGAHAAAEPRVVRLAPPGDPGDAQFGGATHGLGKINGLMRSVSMVYGRYLRYLRYLYTYYGL